MKRRTKIAIILGSIFAGAVVLVNLPPAQTETVSFVRYEGANAIIGITNWAASPLIVAPAFFTDDSALDNGKPHLIESESASLVAFPEPTNLVRGLKATIVTTRTTPDWKLW